MPSDSPLIGITGSRSSASRVADVPALFHHQAVLQPARDVRVSGLAADGVVEAIEIEGRRAIGVQWHPEFLAEPDPVFDWLVTAARAPQPAPMVPAP